VGVTELALDDEERHAFVSHLNGMGMTELVRRETPAHTGRRRDTSKLPTRRGGLPSATRRRTMDDAQQRADR
jgi:hypothetical protein